MRALSIMSAEDGSAFIQFIDDKDWMHSETVFPENRTKITFESNV